VHPSPLLLYPQTLRAIKDGADVRGLYYWTLVVGRRRAAPGTLGAPRSIHPLRCSARTARRGPRAGRARAPRRRPPPPPPAAAAARRPPPAALIAPPPSPPPHPQDNFEWNAGYLMEFGLYAWRPDGSVDRKLKEGAKMLVRGAGRGGAGRRGRGRGRRRGRGRGRDPGPAR
jgi:hypothetical protein